MVLSVPSLEELIDEVEVPAGVVEQGQVWGRRMGKESDAFEETGGRDGGGYISRGIGWRYGQRVKNAISAGCPSGNERGLLTSLRQP